MRPTRLKIDNGAETVPRLINGYGKLPERRGEWGLVLLPASGVGMLLVSWKDAEKPPGVWHIGSTGNAGDGPRAPSPGTVGNLQAQLNAMQALRERGAAGELGDIVLRGEWRAWMHCTADGPVVELHRKLGGYVEARLESCPARGDWAWTLSRKPRWHGEAEERTGKAATLRAAIEEVVQESVALAGSSCGVRDTRRRGALDADYTGKAGAVRPSRSRAGRSVEQWTPGVGRTRKRPVVQRAPVRKTAPSPATSGTPPELKRRADLLIADTEELIERLTDMLDPERQPPVLQHITEPAALRQRVDAGITAAELDELERKLRIANEELRSTVHRQQHEQEREWEEQSEREWQSEQDGAAGDTTALPLDEAAAQAYTSAVNAIETFFTTAKLRRTFAHLPEVVARLDWLEQRLYDWAAHGRFYADGGPLRFGELMRHLHRTRVFAEQDGPILEDEEPLFTLWGDMRDALRRLEPLRAHLGPAPTFRGMPLTLEPLRPESEVGSHTATAAAQTAETAVGSDHFTAAELAAIPQNGTLPGFVGALPVTLTHDLASGTGGWTVGYRMSVTTFVETSSAGWIVDHARKSPRPAIVYPAMPEGRRTKKRMEAWARALLRGLGIDRASVYYSSRSKTVDIYVLTEDLPAGRTGEALQYELKYTSPTGLEVRFEDRPRSKASQQWLDLLTPTAEPPAKPRRRKRTTTKTAQHTPKTSTPKLTEAEKEARLEAKLHDALASSLQSILGANA